MWWVHTIVTGLFLRKIFLRSAQSCQKTSCETSMLCTSLCTSFQAFTFPSSSHPQAQGRLEDQRSRAPGPMDDEDFFSLLLRVQGGRMDEQRTELPCLLQT